MTIVMGLDQHRAQITAEWIDTNMAEIGRGGWRPRIESPSVGFWRGSVASSSRWRWRRRPGGGSWPRSCGWSARSSGKPLVASGNERLLRDGCEAGTRSGGRSGEPSSPSIELWMAFLCPTAGSWNRAHNAGIVAASLGNAHGPAW